MEQTKPTINAVLVGAGGTASYFLPVFLKTYNIKKLTIYDNDILEKHNIDRQHFDPKFIGKNKAEALLSTIRRSIRLPKVEINDRYFHFGETSFREGEHSENTIIICMADNHPARLACLKTADEFSMGCYIACNEYFDSMAYYYKPGVTPDPRERYPEILTSKAGDPIRCTGEALVSAPQLATANLSSAAKVLELMWTYLKVMPELKSSRYKVPYELETRMSGAFCKQLVGA